MYKSILLPVDLSNNGGADKAVNTAIDMARKYGAKLHIATVVPDMGMSIVGTYFDEGFSEKMLEEASKRLQAYCAECCPDDVEFQAHVLHGTIYDEILKAAEAIGCDAIVMASHRPELRDYLIGPNAARVVRHADQSVFIIRD